MYKNTNHDQHGPPHPFFSALSATVSSFLASDFASVLAATAASAATLACLFASAASSSLSPRLNGSLSSSSSAGLGSTLASGCHLPLLVRAVAPADGEPLWSAAAAADLMPSAPGCSPPLKRSGFASGRGGRGGGALHC